MNFSRFNYQSTNLYVMGCGPLCFAKTKENTAGHRHFIRHKEGIKAVPHTQSQDFPWIVESLCTLSCYWKLCFSILFPGYSSPCITPAEQVLLT